MAEWDEDGPSWQERADADQAVSADTEATKAALRLAQQVNALVEIINELVITSRPRTPAAQRKRAWKMAGAVVAIHDARRNHDFMARLERITAEWAAAETGEEPK